MAPRPVSSTPVRPRGAIASRALPTREYKVESGNAKLFVREVGDPRASRTAILLHGGPGFDSGTLKHLEPLASEDLALVRYDQRGCGQSEGRTLGSTFHVRDLDRVREAVGKERVDLVGHSFGGLLAMLYAVSHPERVSSLTLIGSMPSNGKVAQAGFSNFDVKLKKLQAEGVVPDPLPPQSKPLELLKALRPVYFGDPRDPRQEEMTTTFSMSAAMGSMWMLSKYRLGDELRRLDIPVLIVTGTGDPFGTEWPKELARTFKNSQLHLMGESGHFPWLEQPAAFESAFRPFLSGKVSDEKVPSRPHLPDPRFQSRFERAFDLFTGRDDGLLGREEVHALDLLGPMAPADRALLLTAMSPHGPVVASSDDTRNEILGRVDDRGLPLQLGLDPSRVTPELEAFEALPPEKKGEALLEPAYEGGPRGVRFGYLDVPAVQSEILACAPAAVRERLQQVVEASPPPRRASADHRSHLGVIARDGAVYALRVGDQVYDRSLAKVGRADWPDTWIHYAMVQRLGEQMPPREKALVFKSLLEEDGVITEGERKAINYFAMSVDHDPEAMAVLPKGAP